jgi:hypothetical protein
VFWKILMKNRATALDMKHPDYNGAEDDDSNEENSVLKYEDDHSISSDIFHNHILHCDVAQHRGLESKDSDIVPSSIFKTNSNNAANIKHNFEDPNKDVSPPQDLPEQHVPPLQDLPE